MCRSGMGSEKKRKRTRRERRRCRRGAFSQKRSIRDENEKEEKEREELEEEVEDEEEDEEEEKEDEEEDEEEEGQMNCVMLCRKRGLMLTNSWTSSLCSCWMKMGQRANDRRVVSRPIYCVHMHIHRSCIFSSDI